MYCKISLLPLLLAIVAIDAIVTSQKRSPGRENDVIFKCGNIRTRKALWSPIFPFSYLCYPNDEEYWDCIRANIYKSNFTRDILHRVKIDYSRVEAATKKLCKEAPKLKEADPTREFPLGKCTQLDPILQSGHLEDSALLCRNSYRRCHIWALGECHLQTSILYAKYEDESLSNGCLLSDPKFQLLPTYGPELKCYSSINIDHIQPTDYSRIYESYCNQFNYTAVSTCIQETLTLSNNVTSIDLWEDKESYIKKATQFLNDRRTLCNEMATIASFKCMNPTYKPDVDLCQQPMFLPPGPSKYNVSDATKMYALCIKLIYAPCNFDLGQLIYRNMMTYIQ